MWNDDDRDTSGVPPATPPAPPSEWLSIEEVLRKYYARQRFDAAPARCESQWSVRRSHKSRRAAAPAPPAPRAAIDSPAPAAELNDEIMDKIIYRKCWYS